jgi:hypothetical protein
MAKKTAKPAKSANPENKMEEVMKELLSKVTSISERIDNQGQTIKDLQLQQEKVQSRIADVESSKLQSISNLPSTTLGGGRKNLPSSAGNIT